MSNKPCTLLFFALTLSVFTSCKKDDDSTPLVEDSFAAYWVSNGNDRPLLTKGTINADSSKKTVTLYDPGYDHFFGPIITNESGPELFFVVLVPDDANSTVHSLVYKGDTAGGAKVLIKEFSMPISGLAYHAANHKLYYSIYDPTTISDLLYSINTDGSGETRLYPGKTFKEITHMSIDAVSNKLYFIETNFTNDADHASALFKADLNTANAPVQLYDKTNLPGATGLRDRFAGLAVNGTSVYLASIAYEPNMVSYIVIGSADGATPLTNLVVSNPSSPANLAPLLMGLTIDKQKKYIYWLNMGKDQTNTSGSINRFSVASSATPETVFKNISVSGGLYGYFTLSGK